MTQTDFHIIPVSASDRQEAQLRMRLSGSGRQGTGQYGDGVRRGEDGKKWIETDG